MTFSKTKLATISTVLLLTLSTAHADSWSGNISGILGQKQLDNDDWQQHDKQGSIGVLLDIQRDNWPVSIAFDVFGAGDEDKNGTVKQESYSAESHLGIRKIFNLSGSAIRPYVGGGVAFVYAEEKDNSDGTSRSDDDTGTGAWVGGGLYTALTPNFNLGLDLRYSDAKVTVFDDERETQGLSTGISAGFHW